MEKTPAGFLLEDAESGDTFLEHWTADLIKAHGREGAITKIDEIMKKEKVENTASLREMLLGKIMDTKADYPAVSIRRDNKAA